MVKFFQLSLLSLVILLTGCANETAMPRYPEIRFIQQESYLLDVGNIELINSNLMIDGHHVEDSLPISPYQALSIWVNDRIKSKKNNNKLFKITVNDASVIETPLSPTTQGIKAIFTDEQIAMYKASYDVKFELYDNDPVFPKVEMEIKVNRSKSITKNMTLNDRKDLFYQLGNELIQDFNIEFEKNFPSHFNNIIFQGL
jgi:hypothetical protein